MKQNIEEHFHTMFNTAGDIDFPKLHLESVTYL